MSPAEILMQYLVDEEIVTDPEEELDWPCFVNVLPDSPDNAVCAYDTEAMPDGRLQNTGETIEHPGVMFRVRSSTFPVAFEKAKELAGEFDVIDKDVVDDFIILSVTRGPVVRVGQDETRRESLTINVLTTIKET